MVAKAGTLLIPSGPSHNLGLKHLHIVCTDPCENGRQLIVSVTTWTNNLCDGSCVLEAGDHEWLTHKSWVMCRKARIEDAATLDAGVAKGLFEVKAPTADNVLARVVDGLLKSPQTPRKIKTYLTAQLSG